jgi:3-oxoadipate enol-lactonase
MATIRIDDTLDMFYRDDCFAAPWTEPATVLLLHGNLESGAVWYGWVPHLARHYRVLRPDMRGFGQSSPMPPDFPWSLDVIADDWAAFLDSLDTGPVHVVAAKIAGVAARRFAARHGRCCRSLTLVGTPIADLSGMAEGMPARLAEMATPEGMAAWARRGMEGRLGSGFPDAGIDWWSNLMAATSQRTEIGFSGFMPDMDVTGDLPNIACPTLVITTQGSGLASVEATREWQQQIPDSELLVLPGDSYHVAASDPDRCAEAALAFMRGVDGI